MVAEAAFCAFAVLTLVVLPRAREAGQIGAEFDILGFWPACDHLTKICKMLYGEGTAQFTKSFERWRRELRESRVSEVISELEELHDSGSYPGQGDDIPKEINYFTANQQRMDYRRYVAAADRQRHGGVRV